jgi:hypothetical protein
MTECTCYATAVDPDRKKMWEKIFPPDGKIPITCPVPVGHGDLAGQEADFYMVDFARVSPGAKEDMIFNLAEKFDLAPAEIRKDINERGCPVKADGVMVAWCPLHSRAVM